MAKTQPCSKCRRSMVFARGPNGPIPLDARSQAVYLITETPGDESEPVATRVELHNEIEVVADVYQILAQDADPAVMIAQIRQAVTGRPTGGPKKLYISHFANCPNASDFSRGGR